MGANGVFLGKVFEELSAGGMIQVPTQEGGIYAFQKTMDNVQCFVTILNLPDELGDKSYKVHNYIWQLKNTFPCDTSYKQEYLNIFITGNPDSVKDICINNIDTCWVVNRNTDVIMVFEDQDADFHGVYKLLERGLEPPKKRKPPFCLYGLILVNVIIFLFTGLLLAPDMSEHVIELGAMYWPGVVGRGEFWRLLTAMFLHQDINHILNNMVMLYFIGIYVIQYLGNTRFLIIYFASGILAGLTSMGYNMIIGFAPLSFGASGAVFGVTGALVVLCVKYRYIITELSWKRLVIYIILSLWSGFSTSGIDNMAHIGGLVFGMIICFILTWKKELRPVR